MAPGLSQIGMVMRTLKTFLTRLVPGLIVLALGCAGTGRYRIFYHQTFTRPGPLVTGSQVGSGMPGQSIAVTGIYALQYFRPDSMPTLQLCDSLRQPITIYLSERLACDPGALVRVTGQMSAEKSARAGQVLLQPVAFQCLAATQMIHDDASAEYQKLRPKLQRVITPPQSRLQLPAVPHWQTFWLAHSESVILRLVCADLMYAATVEFVFDFPSRTLKQVYAKEYFKGE